MEKQLVVAGKDELLSVEQVKKQVGLIQEIMQGVMRVNEHYGIIPGCSKPSLLKAGAEKLGLTFRFRPEFEIREVELGGGHIDYRITCRLYHIPTNNSVGEGVGSCSTKEGKYRFRNANYKCPECGQETIIKGKKEYGGGWLCWKNKGGCGAKWQTGDHIIENQQVGKIENDNPADCYNTCLKMAKKRAHIDAIITATSASDIFTQDVEDFIDNGIIVKKEGDVSETIPEPKPLNQNLPPEPQSFDPEPPKHIPTAKEIGEMLMQLTDGDKEKAQIILERETSFMGKDKETGEERWVKGKTSCKELTEKQRFVAYGKVKKLLQEKEMAKNKFILSKEQQGKINDWRGIIDSIATTEEINYHYEQSKKEKDTVVLDIIQRLIAEKAKKIEANLAGGNQ